MFDGKILPLVDALKKLDVKPDSDIKGIALMADGTDDTFVKSSATQLLFLDDQLHGRDVRLTARLLPGTRVLHVEKAQTIKWGSSSTWITGAKCVSWERVNQLM